MIVSNVGLAIFWAFAAHWVAAVDMNACTACTFAIRRLNAKLNVTKEELELSREANEKKSASIDKVQKAQTKRWLKREYGVALRAGVEEELEKVCSRDELSATKELQAACAALVEEHEDALPRAVLDSKGPGWCETAVPGCTLERQGEAFASKHKVKTEKAPKAKALYAKGGFVRRLVGSTYSKYLADRQRASVNVLVMLHASAATGAQGYKPSDPRYATAANGVYEMAALLNGTRAKLDFVQMDYQKNEVPGSLSLPQPAGMQLLLYPRGDSTPKFLPEHGEADFAFAEREPFETRLTQLLLTYLKDADGGAIREAMKKREAKAKEAKAKEAGGENSAAEGGGKGDGVKAAKPARPRAARKQVTAEEADRRRQQDCDMCMLIDLQLKRALQATKDELELSHDAAQRKQKAIDGVQKAQTKRWLKQEYKVALAAAVEERLENVCDQANLTDHVCWKVSSSMPTEIAAVHQKWQPVGGSTFDRGDCKKEGTARCRLIVEEHAEPLLRSV